MSDLGFPVFETARQPLQLGSILGWDFLDPRPIYLLNTINALFSFLFFFSFSFLSFFQLILAGKTLFTFFLSVFLSLSLFLSLSFSLSLSLSLPVSPCLSRSWTELIQDYHCWFWILWDCPRFFADSIIAFLFCFCFVSVLFGFYYLFHLYSY